MQVIGLTKKLSKIKAELSPVLLDCVYPLAYLEKYGYRLGKCAECGRSFLSAGDLLVCGEFDCNRGIFDSTLEQRNISFLDLMNEFCTFFKGDKLVQEYEILKLGSILNPFGRNLNYVVAGVNSYTPGHLRETNEHCKASSSYADLQFCLRFNDLEENTRLHYVGFTMVGQHIIENKYAPFSSSWKESAIADLIQYLSTSLGVGKDKFKIHCQYWSDGEHEAIFGPCLEFFISGVEIANQVYMEYHHNDGIVSDLPFRMVDMGAGLQRIFLAITGKTVESSLELTKKDFDYGRSIFHMINSGVFPSKTGIGYNLRRLISILKNGKTKAEFTVHLLDILFKVRPLLEFYGIDITKLEDKIKIIIPYEYRLN